MPTITARQKTYLKPNIKQMSDMTSEELGWSIDVLQGASIEIESYELRGVHAEVKLVDPNYQNTKFAYTPHWDGPWADSDENDVHTIGDSLFTVDDMVAISKGYANKALCHQLQPQLAQVCAEYNITTTNRLVHFLAQLCHESDHFKTTEEYHDGSNYEGRQDLGNVQVGDGKRYKGRGLIQLTGRANYAEVSRKLPRAADILNNPASVASDPHLSCLVSAYFWDSRNLNQLADKGLSYDITKQITKVINGGENGLADRWEFVQIAEERLEDLDVPALYTDVNWADMKAHVSEFFTVREVTQGETRRIPTDDKIKRDIFNLAKKMDELRRAWGSALLVTSWYRPPGVNAAVGGVQDSQHLLGKAVDLTPANGQVLSFQNWADTRWSGALGYGATYRKFVHFDDRNGGKFYANGVTNTGARWNY